MGTNIKWKEITPEFDPSWFSEEGWETDPISANLSLSADDYPRDSSNRFLDKLKIVEAASSAQVAIELRESLPEDQRWKLDRALDLLNTGGTVHHPKEHLGLGVDKEGKIVDPQWAEYACKLEARQLWEANDTQRKECHKRIDKFTKAVRDLKALSKLEKSLEKVLEQAADLSPAEARSMMEEAVAKYNEHLDEVEELLEDTGAEPAEVRAVERLRHRLDAAASSITSILAARAELDGTLEAVAEAAYRRIESEAMAQPEPEAPEEPASLPTNGAAFGGSHWITVGGRAEGDEKHVGGFHVKVSGDGTIQSGHLKGQKVSNLKSYFDKKNKESGNGRPAKGGKFGSGVRSRGEQHAQKSARASGPVEGTPKRPGDEEAGQAGAGAGQPAGAQAAKGVPRAGSSADAGASPSATDPAAAKATLDERVNKRLDRYTNHFRARGQAQVVEWMEALKQHINEAGVDVALESLRAEPQGAAPSGAVQYEGAYDELGESEADSDFVKRYLARAGIVLTNHTPAIDPTAPIISSSSLKNKGSTRGAEGDYTPTDQTFTDKLQESKHLPGLETSEDINTVAGHKVTNLTPEVMAKFDAKYGKGKWLVKSYGTEAYAGFGIFFPQRAQQIRQDAKLVIQDAKQQLAALGYKVYRGEDGTIQGISQGKQAYKFGTQPFDTLNKKVKRLGKQLQQAAHAENGPLLPTSPEDTLKNDYGVSFRRSPDGTPIGITNWDGKDYDFTDPKIKDIEGTDGGAAGYAIHRAQEADEWRRKENFQADPRFMVQPAFAAVGVSDADRALGNTWETAKEGRVHCVVKDGKASAIPYATLVGRGDAMPAVFESEDTRAMQKAVEDAINQLPESERTSQLYAPDVMKTKDGWKVIELNPSAEGGGSDWLGRNPFVIDALVSHMTGREPAHARFIRNLLKDKMKGSQVPTAARGKVPGKPVEQPQQPAKVPQGGSGAPMAVHDVSVEPRDQGGKWTKGGSAPSKPAMGTKFNIKGIDYEVSGYGQTQKGREPVVLKRVGSEQRVVKFADELVSKTTESKQETPVKKQKKELTEDEIELMYEPVGKGRVDLSGVKDKSVHLFDKLKDDRKKELLAITARKMEDFDLDITDHKLQKVALKDIKPSQEGEDRHNTSSENTAETIASGDLSSITKSDLSPVVLDKSKTIVDGNHRYTAAEANGQDYIYAMVPISAPMSLDYDELALSTDDWDEDKHPRQGKGEHGGEFIEKGATRTVKLGGLTTEYSEHKGKTISGPHIKLHNYKQKDYHSCGFVAALTVARYLHPDTSDKDVLAVVRPKKSSGIDGKAMRRALQDLGVKAEFRTDLTVGKLRKLVERGVPVMLTVYPEDWTSDHWVVVQGFDEDRVYLTNYKSVPLSVFKSQWFDVGEGLICRPKESATLSINKEDDKDDPDAPVEREQLIAEILVAMFGDAAEDVAEEMVEDRDTYDEVALAVGNPKVKKRYGAKPGPGWTSGGMSSKGVQIWLYGAAPTATPTPPVSQPVPAWMPNWTPPPPAPVPTLTPTGKVPPSAAWVARSAAREKAHELAVEKLNAGQKLSDNEKYVLLTHLVHMSLGQLTSLHAALGASSLAGTKPVQIAAIRSILTGITQVPKSAAQSSAPEVSSNPLLPAVPHKDEIIWKTGESKSGSLNGVNFGTAPPKFWENVDDEYLDEPTPTRPIERASIMVREPDGRIWIVQPTNEFGGRKHTLPGGSVESGLTDQQNALKEVWEETGLQVKITGYVGDFTDSNTKKNGRLYMGERIGGAPWDAKIESHIIDRKTGKPSAESESVTLVTPDRAAKLLHRTDDLAQLAMVRPIPLDTPVRGTGSEPLKKLLNAITPAAIKYKSMKNAKHDKAGNAELHVVQNIRGFNGKPKVVPSNQLDSLLANGDHIELLRGISDTYASSKLTAEELADQFRNGMHFPGHGIFGSGTYTDSSKGYNNLAPGYGSSGTVMRMAIPKTAKIIKESDLERMVPTNPDAFKGYRNDGGKEADECWRGVQAALAGYDAIVVDGKSKRYRDYAKGTYVVLNRSILTVQDKAPPYGYRIP